MESLASQPLSLVDVPEPTNFNVEFCYNFFVDDEGTNGTGIAPKKYLERPRENFQTILGDIDFNLTVPRYVWLTWTPTITTNIVDNSQPSTTERADLAQSTQIEAFRDKLYKEDSFSLGKFYSFQIKNLDKELLTQLVREAVVMLHPNSAQQSQQEVVKQLNNATSQEVTPELLATTLNDSRLLNVRFFGNDPENPVETQQLLDVIAQESNYLQVSTKLSHDLYRTIATIDSETPLSKQLSDYLAELKTTQQTAQTIHDSNFLDIEEYKVVIDKPIARKRIEGIAQPIVQTIGYLIEKYEITANNATIIHPTIVVENHQANSWVDFQVKYGTNYKYAIRSVAYLEYQTTIDDVTANTAFLVTSKPVVLNLNCVENTPPPPPNDFNIKWDYSKQGVTLTWAFPPNPQRDIKYFQVFKRSSLLEPFQLLCMYDFNDSAQPIRLNECWIDPSLVIKHSTPSILYHDRDFTKDSKAIYAVCSVDAHGITSGYSQQFFIKFDKTSNKLVKELVSVSGAPKAYPNMFLNTDTFIDSIKSEGSKQIEIYFNPEYLKVVDHNEEDLKLLKTGENEYYVLQLLNIDLLVEQQIKIYLENKMESNLLR